MEYSRLMSIIEDARKNLEKESKNISEKDNLEIKTLRQKLLLKQQQRRTSTADAKVLENFDKRSRTESVDSSFLILNSSIVGEETSRMNMSQYSGKRSSERINTLQAEQDDGIDIKNILGESFNDLNNNGNSEQPLRLNLNQNSNNTEGTKKLLLHRKYIYYDKQGTHMIYKMI